MCINKGISAELKVVVCFINFTFSYASNNISSRNG